MVAPNDMDIIRILAVTRPLPGKREECFEIIRRMHLISKPYARDFHFYAEPDTGNLINWESFESIDHLRAQGLKVPKAELIERIEIVRYEIYIRDDEVLKRALTDYFSNSHEVRFSLAIE